MGTKHETRPAAISTARLAREIDAELRKGSNRARMEATLGYYPSGLENLGVGAPHLRSVVREVRRKLKGQPPRTAVAVAKAVVGQKTIEGRQAAYEILAGHPGALEVLGLADLEALGRGMDNWASVDGFCCCVAGQVWRMGGIRDVDVKRWARSKDRWWRRAAVVATVPLNAGSKGGTGDTRRTLMIVEMVMGDRDPMVAKAVSWALRALIEPDDEAVEGFLRLHGDELAALVVREVGNKLRTGRKNPGRGKGGKGARSAGSNRRRHPTEVIGRR